MLIEIRWVSTGYKGNFYIQGRGTRGVWGGGECPVVTERERSCFSSGKIEEGGKVETARRRKGKGVPGVEDKTGQ